MDQDFIKKLNDILEVNLENEQFGVNELAEAIGVSRSQLHRKLKSIEGTSPSRFIREYRLQKAMEMLQNNVATASEISYRVGFGSPTYFNTSFRELYGYPPGEVKFRKESTQKENNYIKDSFPERNLKSIKRRYITIVSLIIVLITASVYYFYQHAKNNITSKISEIKANDKSIAILPFKNLSSDVENQYFADGVMEVILNHLTSVKKLKVISRTSMEKYRETNKTIPEIAKELGVSYILEGSVQKNENEIKIIAQLIDAKNDKHLWSTDIKKEYKDIFELQSTIAKQISKELNTELSDVELSQIEKKPTNNIEAYNLYLKGLYFVRNRSIEKSFAFLEQAIELDPEFARAYSELAAAYVISMHRGLLFPKKEVKKVKELSQKAISLDNSLGQPHAILAIMMYRYEWNWIDAEKEFLIALNMNTNNIFVHIPYSNFLDYTGRFEEAREQINKALLLDPISSIAYHQSSLYYYFSGSYERALVENRKAIEIRDSYLEGDWLNFEIYIAQKKYDLAVSELQKIYSTNNESKEISNIYAQFGINGVYRWFIESNFGNYNNPSSNYNNPYYLAQKYAFIGENEKALSLLEKSAELRVSRMSQVNRDPYFKNLKSGRRFRAIIRKMGLDDYLNQQ